MGPHHRPGARPVSYLMDYGPDYLTAPGPADADGPLTLAEKCLCAVIFYALVWAFFALLILALQSRPAPLEFSPPPAEGTSTLSPDVAR